MRDDLPSGTVTFLLSDIEGSTRLLHGLGDRYAEVLADHRNILRAAAARYDGAEVDTQGDAFFFAFPTAAGCVMAAVEAQRGLASHPWPEGGVVRVRIGAHTGEPTRTDEGYVGMDVHAAARICSSGHGGQILLSRRTGEETRAELEKHDLDLRDLGEHRLKDLDGPQRIFQVVIPELLSDFSPIKTLDTRPNNLPTPPTPFIGRAREVASVRDLVLREGVRVVTLTGPGGTGKSRLGLRVATELLHAFRDGVYYVPLAPVRNARRVLSAMARAIGIREGPGQTLMESLVDALSDKEFLLLIDNFEHVRQGARDLAELMSQCPRVKALLTSREVLRLSGEHEWPVPPLGLPEPGKRASVAELAQFEAVRLFRERAEAARPKFSLAEENAYTVVEICQRLDGLPLAIELAAAQVRTMEPAELLGALESRLSVLTDGPIDLPERQQTLRDAIAWSFELLEPAEQALYRRLSVFVGGCSLEAAEQVCGLDGSGELEPLLASLVSRSLLGSTVTGGAGAKKVIQVETTEERTRYAMLETIREYATECLEEAGEAEPVRVRHRDWCLSLAEEAEPKLRSATSDQWLERLELEHANMRAALAGSLGDEKDGVERALRLGAALQFFWYQHGYLSEGREWLDRALQAGNEAVGTIRARALLAAAGLARHLSEEEDGVRYCEAALSLYRAAEDKAGIARVLSELGATLQRLGQYGNAEEALTESLGLFRELGELERTAFTLNFLGMLEQLRDNLPAAVTHYEECLEIGRQIGDRNNIATALLNLSEVRLLQGEHERADELLRESLELYGAMRQPNAIAYCLELLAGLRNAAGDGEGAARLFGASDATREEAGTPVESFNLERYRSDVAETRELAGSEVFQASWDAGRALSLDEVLQEVQANPA